MIARRAAASVILIALALVGCVPVLPGATGGPSPQDPIAASRNSPTAPASFRERPELPSCGEYVVEQANAFPDDSTACLDDAFDSGAELVVQVFTIEGDPVIFYYRVGPEIAGIEIFVDSTLDRFGSVGWSHQQCPSATSFYDQTDCAEVD